jgi:uncharacterized membrane protein YqiK
MQDAKLKSLAIAIAEHRVETKRKGKASAAKVKALRETFRVAMDARIKKMLTEKRKAIRNSAHLWETLEQNESFLDGIKAIGSAAAGAVGNAVADGLGINGKKVGKIVRGIPKEKRKSL